MISLQLSLAVYTELTTSHLFLLKIIIFLLYLYSVVCGFALTIQQPYHISVAILQPCIKGIDSNEGSVFKNKQLAVYSVIAKEIRVGETCF